MPKSAKKRRDKAADFSKAKLKLGKGKQVASNVVNTSFKARSIALPNQRIVVEKDITAFKTRRGLTFEDLLVHLKHYSASTRKDALLGLRELMEPHPELLDSSLTALISGCVRIIGDEDAGVRKALLTFFSWLLPRIHKEDLIPHSSLILLFTTSAQTHIFPEIRIDAIRFLGILLERIPQTVVAGWDGGTNGHGPRILEGYLGILNGGTQFGETGPLRATSTASVSLTAGSKLVVLQSLATFLSHSLSSYPSNPISDESPTLRTWYLLPSFSNPEGYYSFNELLQPYAGSPQPYDYRYWQSEVDLGECHDEFPHTNSFSASSVFDGHRLLSDLTTGFGIEGTFNRETIGGTSVAIVARLARALHQTLVATFLDCAPSVFAPNANPSNTEVQTVVAVIQIAHSLYDVIMQVPVPGEITSTSEDLKTILGHMAPYFPFRLTGNRDIKHEQAFQDLNLSFCKLTSLLLLSNKKPVFEAREKARQSYQGSSNASGVKNALSIHTLRVSTYVIQLLQGEYIAMHLGKPLTTSGYLALLPTIWALLNDTIVAHQSMCGAVLRATVEHAIKTSSKSALKRVSIEFLARLVLLNTEPHYQGNFRLGRDTQEDQKLEEWVIHLPQTLWELGSSNLPTSEIIFQFLLRSVHRKSSLIHAKTIASLQSKLVPYFIITHAVRGKLPGPYSKLPTPSRLRRLVLDLVATINQGTTYDDTLSSAVDSAVAKTKEYEYWTHIRSPFLYTNSQS